MSVPNSQALQPIASGLENRSYSGHAPQERLVLWRKVGLLLIVSSRSRSVRESSFFSSHLLMCERRYAWSPAWAPWAGGCSLSGEHAD